MRLQLTVNNSVYDIEVEVAKEPLPTLGAVMVGTGTVLVLDPGLRQFQHLGVLQVVDQRHGHAGSDRVDLLRRHAAGHRAGRRERRVDVHAVHGAQ